MSIFEWMQKHPVFFCVFLNANELLLRTLFPEEEHFFAFHFILILLSSVMILSVTTQANQSGILSFLLVI